MAAFGQTLLALKISSARNVYVCPNAANVMCIFVYFFIQVEAVGSVKNINIKNKNIN